MGSKNLKAVAARGSGRITVADRDRFLVLKREVAEKIRENAISGGGLPRFGTGVLVNIINENYILPVQKLPERTLPCCGERLGGADSRYHPHRKDGVPGLRHPVRPRG
jgi:Aldehyde:ferredoxin oxidoreductase